MKHRAKIKLYPAWRRRLLNERFEQWMRDNPEKMAQIHEETIAMMRKMKEAEIRKELKGNGKIH